MWVFNVYLDNSFKLSRDVLVKKLAERKIETRNAFVPINKQKTILKIFKSIKSNDCPNANYIMKNGFYLPSGNTITNKEIDFICNTIKSILEKINNNMFALDEPLVGKKELQYLTKAIKSGWISSHGQFVKNLKRNLQSILVLNML